MADTLKPTWEGWTDNPLMIDQPEGTEVVEPETFQMQIQQPYGGWEPLSNPRTDRDEVTRLQAFYLTKDKDGQPEGKVRVLRRCVTWTVDEVPGDGDGETPAATILARNDKNTERLLTEGNQPPAQ